MIKQLLLISRPRFWLYTAGPFLLGITAAKFWEEPGMVPIILLFGCYFLFPGNLFIYGVNDIFDTDTDVHNQKKTEYETLLKNKKLLIIAIIITTILALLSLLILPSLSAALIFYFFCFFFFSFFYSAPPIRAKAIPFVDSFFNILYIFPGIFGYFLAGGETISLTLILAGWCWCIAMHAYSAIPDIAADTTAGIHTTATILRKDLTLFYCLFFYLLAGILSFSFLGSIALIASLCYASMIIWSLTVSSSAKVFIPYTFFPYLNNVIGMILFFTIFFS